MGRDFSGGIASSVGAAGADAAIGLATLEQQRRNGDLLVGNANGRDFGALATLCRTACAGGALAIGAAATDAQAGAVYLIGATDRVFYGGLD